MHQVRYRQADWNSCGKYQTRACGALVASQDFRQYPCQTCFSKHNNGGAVIVANPEHVELVMKGQEAIRAWRGRFDPRKNPQAAAAMRNRLSWI
jgi:hypothetical protein